MNNLSLIRPVILFFAYWLVQVIIAKNLELFEVAFCFVYVGYLLQLPLQTDKSLLLLVAFVLGVFTDMGYDTLGIHAFCMVLIAYLRPFLITLIAPAEEIYELSIRSLGFNWYFQYTIILVFIHHLGLFLLQQFSFSMILDTLLKAVCSTLFTTFAIIMVQYIFYSPALTHVRK